MPIKSQENSLGAWAFLAGVILALVVGLSTTLLPIPAIAKYSAYIFSVLLIIGVILGFFIAKGKDTQTFMITGTVLVIVTKFGGESVRGSLLGVGLGDAVTSISSAFLALFVPATIIVALKTVFSIANV